MRGLRKEICLAAFFRLAVYGGALLVAAGFCLVAGYILMRGVPEFTEDLFAYRYTEESLTIFPALMTTVYLTGAVLLVAAPLGIGTAIWTSEYLPARSVARSVIRLFTNTMNGMPSILYGLFGFFIFVIGLSMGYSLFSGAAVMVIMILPLIIRTAEESLEAVPAIYRETGAAMGISKWALIRHVILPEAAPGIMAGLILAMGRMAGAAAALIYTSGTVPRMPESFWDSGRPLAVHVYMLYSEDVSETRVFAAAAVLLIVTGLMTALAEYIGRRFHHGR